MPSLKNPPKKIKEAIEDFTMQTQCITRFVRDRVAISVDKQKENADKRGRSNLNTFKVNQKVFLSTKDLPKDALPNMQSTKLIPRYIGPFKILKCKGDAYTLDIPSRMRLHPTFYVGRLKEYHPSRPSIEEPVVGGSTPIQHRGESPYSLDNNHDESSCSHDARLNRRDNSIPHFSDDRPGPPPLIDSHGDERWVVEAIVDHKPRDEPEKQLVSDGKQGKSHRQRRDKRSQSRRLLRQYRVRWVGYPPEQDSWSPRHILEEDVPDILHEYESRYGL